MKIAFNDCFATNEIDQTIKAKVPVRIGGLVIYTGTAFYASEINVGETSLQNLRNKELIVMFQNGIYSIEGFYY